MPKAYFNKQVVGHLQAPESSTKPLFMDLMKANIKTHTDLPSI